MGGCLVIHSDDEEGWPIMAVTETMFDKMLDALLKIKDILEEKL